MRDLNEIFVIGQTTLLSFGGASVAQVIKMMEFQGKDYHDTLVILLGTNDVSRISVTPEGKWATDLPSERTEGEIQAQTRGAMHDTA